MALYREDIEKEIAAVKAAIKAHEQGALINKIVLEAFEKELEKYPAAEQKPVKKPIGVE